MLTPDQKAHILRRAGIAVPARPEAQMTAGHRESAGARTPDLWHGWAVQIETRYARYGLERATRSLRQAEVSMQMNASAHASRRDRTQEG